MLKDCLALLAIIVLMSPNVVLNIQGKIQKLPIDFHFIMCYNNLR